MIDRKLYKKSFTKDSLPSWQCPTCNSGILTVKEKEFIYANSAETTAIIKEDFFEPEMAKLTFTALLKCSNPKCVETVTCSGFGRVKEKEYYTEFGHPESVYINYFKPLFFYPPLHIFIIPKDTPEDVKEAIVSSFSLAFNNHSAAANQIRIALECLLTHLKIKRFNIKNGKRRRLNLHQRIELLPVKYQKIKDVCLAIKWLGNAGSHCDDTMSFDDLFDGYDMLSFVLEELYTNKHKFVKRIAKRINEKKGV